MSKRLTIQDFIERAKQVHGNRYDYSKVEYKAAIKKVTIICPKHGEFKQTPANHCTGYGCQECGGNKRLTLDKFYERAKKVHGNRYDYSKVRFNNVESKIEIICTKHGSFFQRLASHLKGFGCDKCGRQNVAQKLSHSIDQFLLNAKECHGDFYDYSKVTYKNALTKVAIICPKHGEFKQSPSSHIRGVGCPKCGDESMAAYRIKTTEEFIKEAKNIHGDKYDYSQVEYKKSHEKVKIICPKHGSFWQSPMNHTKFNTPAGCPGCAESGFDQTKPGLLYYLAFDTDWGDTLYKIGITNLSVKKRYSSVDLARIRLIKTWHFKVGQEAFTREQKILDEFEKYLYKGVDVLDRSGNTELFTKDVLELDHEKSISKRIDENANLTVRSIMQFDLNFSKPKS